jgi:two-component system NarL family sensor kinase
VTVRRLSQDDGSALTLAVLRMTLLTVIFVGEQLIDSRRLAGSAFFPILGIAVVYAVAGLVPAFKGADSLISRTLRRVQPMADVVLLAGLAAASGGAYSDVRKAFFVIPLAAAFSERPLKTAGWSLLSVLAFSVQAIITQGHPAGAHNTWLAMTVDQDLYLLWTAAAATLLALALRRRSVQVTELAGSRQRLVTQAIESVERERARLAGALHDSPVQNLMAARHDLRRAERTGDPESFADLRDAIDVTIAQLREEIFDLHPHVLDHAGLGAALEQVARRHGASASTAIEISVQECADPTDRQVLFALARELLTNAVKHAGADAICVTVSRVGAATLLVVSDDGCGIAAGRPRQALLDGHIGLASVTERVEGLHGSLEIASPPGGGTRVTITLPLSGASGSADPAPRHAPAVAPLGRLREAVTAP